MTTKLQQDKGRAAVRERRNAVFALRLAGLPFDHIAAELGYRSASGPRSAFEAFMRDTADSEEVDRVRRTELARLDRLWQTWWPRALGTEAQRDPVTGVLTTPEVEPSVEAVKILLSLMDRRGRLLGLGSEPMIDVEEELRKAARLEGLDEEEMLKDAAGIIAQYMPRSKGRLRLVR